jgi:hypothetical protein
MIVGSCFRGNRIESTNRASKMKKEQKHTGQGGLEEVIFLGVNN